MISLAPIKYDIGGGLVWSKLEPGSKVDSAERRVSRRRLLDGTVSIYDGGYSDGDRTFTLLVRPTKAQLNRVREIATLYNRVHLSAPDGFYRAAIQHWDYSPPTLQITLLIETRLSN